MSLRLRRSAFVLVPAAAVAAIVLARFRAGATMVASDDLLGQLSHENIPRTIEPRLSVVSAYHACRLTPPADGTVPGASCGTGVPSPDAVALAGRAARSATTTADAASLHAVAVADLAWDATRAPVEAAIRDLQAASRQDPRSAAILADLAAAWLIRAGRAQSPRDLLEAIDAADRARELDPGSLPARWNLALALERLAVDDQATRAWRDYLALDSTSAWAREARARIAGIEAAHVLPHPADSSSAALEAYAARAPQEAAVRGWEDELGSWGAAVVSGDSVTAAFHLAHAAALARGIAERGGDASLGDAVTAIRAVALDGRRTRELASAHVDYAAGRRLYENGDYPGASGPLERAARSAGASPPLRRWATLFHAATLAYARRFSEARGVMEGVASQSDSLRYPGLIGRARWMIGTTALRMNRPQDADGEFRRAQWFMGRAGEGENLATVPLLRGDLAFSIGNSVDGFDEVHQALLGLRPYRTSVWLHGAFQILAAEAASSGLVRAAMHLEAESLSAALRARRPVYVVEARVELARLLTLSGRRSEAERELVAARPVVERFPPGAREWFVTDIRMAAADLLAAENPARAAASLDSVLASNASVGTPHREVLARTARAGVRLRLGRVADAAVDLDSVIAILDRERASITSTRLRAAVVDEAQPVFDRMVMIQADAGDVRGALRYLDAGREVFAPVPSFRRAAPVRVPAGKVGIEYALIGDTLLTWTVRDTALELTRTIVSRERVLQVIERVHDRLEQGAEEPALRHDLSALYEVLLRPVERRLGSGATTLLVVADGEIASVPFAALWDASRRRYLVEVHAVSFTPSLRLAPRVWPASSARASTLVLAEPGPSPFGAIPHAAAEGEAIAGLYPRSILLADADATPGTLLNRLRSASVFHFSGHAAFDDERPERSFLLLSGSGGNGRLTAEAVERADLRRLRLVVLSACETLSGPRRRSRGFAGLATGFLAAGAGGVVGSEWRVDDAATEPLMIAFHRAFRDGAEPPAALRSAQLSLLRSRDPALRSPSAWGAFRYLGS